MLSQRLVINALNTREFGSLGFEHKKSRLKAAFNLIYNESTYFPLSSQHSNRCCLG